MVPDRETILACTLSLILEITKISKFDLNFDQIPLFYKKWLGFIYAILGRGKLWVFRINASSLFHKGTKQ